MMCLRMNKWPRVFFYYLRCIYILVTIKIYGKYTRIKTKFPDILETIACKKKQETLYLVII